MFSFFLSWKLSFNLHLCNWFPHMVYTCIHAYISPFQTFQVESICLGADLKLEFQFVKVMTPPAPPPRFFCLFNVLLTATHLKFSCINWLQLFHSNELPHFVWSIMEYLSSFVCGKFLCNWYHEKEHSVRSMWVNLSPSLSLSVFLFTSTSVRAASFHSLSSLAFSFLKRSKGWKKVKLICRMCLSVYGKSYFAFRCENK